MPVRVNVEPTVLSWALDVASNRDALAQRFKVEQWLRRRADPTLDQLRTFARAAGIPFGYLLLTAPPGWTLPVPDLREGFAGGTNPSTDLMAVLSQSQRRQAWYREYALRLGTEPLDFVGSAHGLEPEHAAAMISTALHFEVADRQGNWSDTRRTLLTGFEALGGLCVATSMVGNNTHRLLDEDEFRGFALVDDVAPLVFVNTQQTLNGQIFTLAHEFAHVWRGTPGIGDENPRIDPRSATERWCNAVASEVLVPRQELHARYRPFAAAPLTDVLDELASQFRCGTLVVLQALHRTGLRHIDDFTEAYDEEVARLRTLRNIGQERGRAGGDYYHNQPYRVGERLSKALIADALEGHTTIEEAMGLMSIKSLSTFDEYARRLGAA